MRLINVALILLILTTSAAQCQQTASPAGDHSCVIGTPGKDEFVINWTDNKNYYRINKSVYYFGDTISFTRNKTGAFVLDTGKSVTNMYFLTLYTTDENPELFQYINTFKRLLGIRDYSKSPTNDTNYRMVLEFAIKWNSKSKNRSGDIPVLKPHDRVPIYKSNITIQGKNATLVKAKWDPTKPGPRNDPKNVHLDPIFEVRYFPDEYTDAHITAPASEWKDSNFEAAISSLKISPLFTMALTATDWYNKGLALYNQGKYDEAIKALDNATELDPQYVEAWETKGWALHFQERYNEEAKAFGEIVEINPQDKLAWNSKGLALSEQEKYNEAIQAYERAIELDPKFAPPWNNKGTALDKLGKYDESIECSYTGLKLLNFTDRYHLFALGQAHYEEGNYAAAIRYYDEVITRDLANATDPSNATVWCNKGLAFKALNRTTEADAALAKAKELGYED